MNSKTKIPSPLPIIILFALSPFLIGIYYEWLSCAVSLALLAYLIYCRAKAGEIIIPKTPLMLACAAIVIFFAISPVWAVDKGMAMIGTAKFLPLPLFCITSSQIDSESREKMLKTVPICGAVMTAVSFAMSRFPQLSDKFLVNGRLSGFFQYSNTFAAYLLAGLIITVLGYKKLKFQIPLCALLLFGILMSGSRTVFVILMVCVIAFVIFIKDKRLRFSILGIATALIAVAAVFAAVTGNFDTVGRFLTSSLGSSTFIGRILYYKDALPVILKHPLGLGYMGYYFLQGSFKTGVYTVVNIHNDFLQILLDIGWASFALCLWAAVRAVIKSSKMSRAVILAIFAHSLLDFDLQYISICFLLILAMTEEPEKCFSLRSVSMTTILSVIGTAFSIYFGIASGLYYLNDYEATARIYPAYTSAYVGMISNADDLDEMEQLADKIFKYNDSVSIAHSIKGRAAFSHGDVESMIDYMRRAIALSRYRIDEYSDYRDMLRLAIDAYEKAGDKNSADYCREYLAEINVMLKRLEQDTSPLAWKIDQKPIFEMD